MNDREPNLEALEQKLRALTPARPSLDLMTRLSENRRAAASKDARPCGIRQPLLRKNNNYEAKNWQTFLWRIFVPLTAVAAVVALVFFVWRNQSSTPPMTEKPFRQVESANFFVGARDAGVVHTSDHQPYRAVRAIHGRKSVWEDETGARVEQVMPEETIVLVSMPVY